MSLTFLAAATVAPALAGAAASSSPSPFRVGEPAPEMTLPSIADGARLSLSDFRGQRLMLHVWASW